MGWGIYPEGLTKILVDFKHEYGDIDMYITENGTAVQDTPDSSDFVFDRGRIIYIREHLLAIKAAMEAGVRMKGYYIWSFLDNFEWAYGYDPRFGIVRVDYDTLRRTPKKSYYWFQDVIRLNGLWE
jgi:beta-glucosidase